IYVIQRLRRVACRPGVGIFAHGSRMGPNQPPLIAVGAVELGRLYRSAICLDDRGQLHWIIAATARQEGSGAALKSSPLRKSQANTSDLLTLGPHAGTSGDSQAEEAVGLLLKRDHVRTGQRYGVWFQGLVRQVRIARIQDIIETDGRLVVAAS